jgi:nitrate reductase gamma subunit
MGSAILTAGYAVLLYVGVAILIVGLIHRIRVYFVTPAPLKIATTPAPTTTGGVVFRLFREVALFESLFKSNKWIWLFGYIFHVALAVVILRHFRYFSEPVWTIVVLIQDIGVYAGIAMVVGLLGLWFRRFAVPRVRYISGLSDHLMLAMLVGIGISGLAMKFMTKVDIIAVKAFALGWITFNWQPLPAHPALLVHLGLVALLMIVFPFSKLLHAPGVFFSPTRNQVDNPREKRHLAPWAAELETPRAEAGE